MTSHTLRERAIVVHVRFSSLHAGMLYAEEHVDECVELVRSAGAEVIEIITASRSAPDPKFFVGSGKAQEIKTAVETQKANLVIVNHALTPSQESHLSTFIGCSVVDRTGLILDIFAQRARTYEGKLQVELAQLEHLATRLVRGWTHLERQRGGIGLRGPGETQLETDRRLLKNRVRVLKERLEKVKQQRALSRQARKRHHTLSVSLVGYTNAGKSTLFNQLTDADVYVANQLFATLDPTLRRLSLPKGVEIVLADTVGFIQHLPHQLVDAFHATLEEVKEADLLIHVIDAADSKRQSNIEQVESVLRELDALSIPRIEVFNKIDLLSHVEPHVENDLHGDVRRIWLSAFQKENLETLKGVLSEKLFNAASHQQIILKPEEAGTRAKLYAQKAVIQERLDEEGNWHLTIISGKLKGGS